MTSRLPHTSARPSTFTDLSGTRSRTGQHRQFPPKRQITVTKLPRNRVRVQIREADGTRSRFEFSLGASPELQAFRKRAVTACLKLPKEVRAPFFARALAAHTDCLSGEEDVYSWSKLEALSVVFAPRYKLPVASHRSLERHVPQMNELGITDDALTDSDRTMNADRDDFWNAPPGYTAVHRGVFRLYELELYAEAAATEIANEKAAATARRKAQEHARYERRKAAVSGIPHETGEVTGEVTGGVSGEGYGTTYLPNASTKLPNAVATSSSRARSADDDEAASPPSPSGESEIVQTDIGQTPEEAPAQEFRDQEDIDRDISLDQIPRCPRHGDNLTDNCQACVDNLVQGVCRVLNYIYGMGIDEPGFRSVIRNGVSASRLGRFFTDDNPVLDEFRDQVFRRGRSSVAGYFISLLPGKVLAFEHMGPQTLADLAMRREKARAAEEARRKAERERKQDEEEDKERAMAAEATRQAARAERKAAWDAAADPVDAWRRKLMDAGIESWEWDDKIADWRRTVDVSEALDRKLPNWLAEHEKAKAEEEQRDQALAKWLERLPGTETVEGGRTVRVAFDRRGLDNAALTAGPLVFRELAPGERWRRFEIVRWLTKDEHASLRVDRQTAAA